MSASRERMIRTPEQVEIRLRPAGLGRRGLAVLVDTLCALAVIAGAGTLAAALLPSAIAGAATATLGFAILTGWHVLFELRHEGRTPGKQLMGLRVVDAAGLPLTPAQSAVRNAARALDALPLLYGVGAVAAALDPLRRRVGDRLADTVVVTEAGLRDRETRAGRALAFNSLEDPRILRLMRKRLSPDARDFVLAVAQRAPSLQPAARYDLMEDTARHLRDRLEIDDPHLSAEGVVKAVAALLGARVR
jgi:uncharacterized RDD family membrane protein YckC